MIHEHVFKQLIHIINQELTKQAHHLNIKLKHLNHQITNKSINSIHSIA